VQEQAETPAATLLRLTNGYQISQALHVAATLRLADFFGDGPTRAEDVAAKAQANPDAIFRLLRALSSVGVFHKTEDDLFTLTPVSELLRSDNPRSFRGWPAMIGRPFHWNSWGAAVDSVRTGQDSFRSRFGKSVWDLRADQPEEAEVFTAAMAGLSAGAVDAIIRAFDFGRFPTIVDIGGADGFLLGSILQQSPGSSGTVFDLPYVVPSVRATAERLGVADRLGAEGGSYYETIPGGADAYTLKSVLHDCSDEETVRILSNVAGSMKAGSSVIVIEPVIGEVLRPPIVFSDINMLVNTGGRERTEREWSSLFGDAGLQVIQIVPTGSNFSVIEGRPT
jgi:hypothetical protein